MTCRALTGRISAVIHLRCKYSVKVLIRSSLLVVKAFLLSKQRRSWHTPPIAAAEGAPWPWARVGFAFAFAAAVPCTGPAGEDSYSKLLLRVSAGGTSGRLGMRRESHSELLAEGFHSIASPSTATAPCRHGPQHYCLSVCDPTAGTCACRFLLPAIDDREEAKWVA